MNRQSIYNLLTEVLKNATKEQMEQLIFRFVEKISPYESQEVIAIIESIFPEQAANVDINGIIKKIHDLEHQFALIENCEICFHSENCESGLYDTWYDDYEEEYYDSEKLGNIINSAYELASLLMLKRDFKKAQKLYDLIIFTKYPIKDKDKSISVYEIKDIVDYGLVNIDITRMCLYTIFITLLIDNDRCNKLYQYYQTYTFNNIRIQDSLKINSVLLQNVDYFWSEWIKFLSSKESELSLKLLEDAIKYNNFSNYREILSLNTKTHPQIYILIFKRLEKLKKYIEIITIGNEVLDSLNDNVKGQISLIIANAYTKINPDYDISNYLFLAFKFNQTIPNLIRIINSGYLEKYQKEINDIKNNSSEKNDDLHLIYYFSGDFSNFFDFFKDREIIIPKYSELYFDNNLLRIELMSYLLCNNTSKIFQKLTSSICNFIFHNNSNDSYNVSSIETNNKEILDNWRSHFTITPEERINYLSWVENSIKTKLDDILSNKKRDLYSEAAYLVYLLDECLASNNCEEEGNIITYYKTKYRRFYAFQKRLKRFFPSL